MTQPAQYISGRTVQEQMNELISYVDTRATEVATDAIASDVAQVHQDMLDADADASAAAASAAAAAGTLANAVKKTGEASQSIAGDIAISGDLSVSGDAGVQGQLSVLGGCDLRAPVKVPTVATGTFDDNAANGNKVKNELDNYAPMLRTTGNQSATGNKNFLGNIICGSAAQPLTGGIQIVTNGAYRRIRLQNIDEDVGSLPAATVGYPIIAWTDTNDTNVCTLLTQRLTDGKTRLVATLRNADGTSKTIILGVSD